VRVAVIGTGLIGGSVGMAARRRLGAEVRGIGPEAPRAMERGALDVACASIEEAVDDADVAFVATPLGVVSETVAAVLAAAPADCVVTDVGSTKAAVVAACADPRFVGGHPMSGGEGAGVDHAREDLFDGAAWYLTPGPAGDGAALERLAEIVRRLGARPTVVDAELHDRLMAAVSHLPHVVANVLVAQAHAALDEAGGPSATGPGFRDATRIAGANPPLWADILLANRAALVAELDAATQRLAQVRAALVAGDRDTLLTLQRQAADERRSLLEGGR